MKTTEYNKLVRDNIPSIIEKDSNTVECKYHQCKDDKELIKAILDKVVEEANELQESYNNGSISLEELADLLEVIDKLKHEMPWTDAEIDNVKKYKAYDKGKFEFNFILDSITHKDKEDN